VRVARAAHRLVTFVGAGLEADLVLDALAHDVGMAVEGNTFVILIAAAGDEQLTEPRHRAQRAVAEHAGNDGDVAPAKHREALLLDDPFDLFNRLLGFGGILRKEGNAGCVLTSRRQVEVDDCAIEGVGHLDQNARAVAGVRVGAERAAVLHVAQRANASADDVVGLLALDVRNEVDATRVVLVAGVVKTLRRRKILRTEFVDHGLDASLSLLRLDLISPPAGCRSQADAAAAFQIYGPRCPIAQ